MQPTWWGWPDDGPLTWDVVVRRGLRVMLFGGMFTAVLVTELRHWSMPRSAVAVVLLVLCATGSLLLWPLRRQGGNVPAILLPTTALAVALAIVSPTSLDMIFLFPPVVIAARRWRIEASAAVAVVGAVGYAGGTWLFWGHGPDWWMLPALAGTFLGGLLDHVRQERMRQQAELAAQAERTQAAEARSATLAERSRIAREIHDVLAHSLAALAVQLEAADALLDSGRDEQAREVVRTGRRLAREGLAETKQAVLALREGGTVPLPQALSSLLADVAPDARLDVTGTARELSPEAGFALYRIAQEALTNAAKHAAGATVRVELAFGAAEVALTVANGPVPDGTPAPLATTGGGYGLTGMRERLEPLGGTLTAGPAGGGWQVTARIGE